MIEVTRAYLIAVAATSGIFFLIWKKDSALNLILKTLNAIICLTSLYFLFK